MSSTNIDRFAFFLRTAALTGAVTAASWVTVMMCPLDAAVPALAPRMRLVAAPGVSDPMWQRFIRAAEKYRDIGSYEGSATASRTYPPDFEIRSTVRVWYVSERFTPPDLDPPAIVSGAGYCCSQTYDANGRRTSLPRSPERERTGTAVPGSAGQLQFDQLARHLTTVTSVGTETLTIGGAPKVCDVLDATYGPMRLYREGHTVRYWIDQASDTIWRLRFDQKEHLVDGDPVTWTLTFDTWTENQPPSPQTVGIGSRSGNARTDLVGKAAPEIRGHVGDMPFALSNLHGTVVVVVFWGTECGQLCAAEMRALEHIRTRWSTQDLQIVAVTEDAADDVASWMTWYGRSLPVAIADRGTAAEPYDLRSAPLDTVVVDRNGTVVQEWAGLLGEKRLTAAIEAALAN